MADTDAARQPSEAWSPLWRYRSPIDPDYGGPTSVATLWRDNLGGLLLGIDHGDGATVALLPIPVADMDDLGAAIREHLTTPPPSQSGPSEATP